MTTILTKILPVVLVLIIGAVCRKRGFFNENNTQTLKDVAVNITLPFVLLSAFGTTHFSAANMLIPSISFLACIVALLLGFVLFKLMKMQGKVMPYLTSGFEAGMLGYALFAILRNGNNLSDFALIDLGQVAFVFTIYRILISNNRNAKDIIINITNSPVIWGMVAGILLSVSGMYAKLSNYIDSISNFVSAPTGTIILLCIGSDLMSQKVNLRKALAPVVLRIAVLSIVFALVYYTDMLLGIGINHQALLLMFALPAPFVLPIFATAANERADVASALSIQTIITLIIFGLMAINI